MKKLIFKTAIITLSVTLIAAMSAFGIVSFVAPAAMMRFCDSLGLENLSGDYAYQQYQISGDVDYLARSFEIAASLEINTVASARFDEFYGEDGSEQRTVFAEFCTMQNGTESAIDIPEDVSGYDYRSVVCGQAAVVKYRLAANDEEKAEICDFVVGETGEELSPESPIAVLAAEAATKRDAPFCAMLLSSIRSEGKFDTQNEHYLNIVNFLEEATK